MASEQKSIKFHRSKLSIELAHEITSGDNKASNEFVQINYKWLLFIIRKKFTKSNNQEDIVHDTFMIVIMNLRNGKVKNLDKISFYLRTTAINIGYEYLRKDKKFISAVDQDLLDEIVIVQEDILSTIIWDDKVSYVKKVIDELNVPRDKDILKQFYFKDIDKKTICQNLDLSSEHFDRVLYRAKERLKQLINHSKQPPNNSQKELQRVNENNNKTNGDANFIVKVNALYNKAYSFIFKTMNRMRFYA